MSGFETVASVATLADVAVKALRLVRRVEEAPREAERLYRRAKDVASLAEIVEQTINARRTAGWASQQAIEIDCLMQSSISQCRQALLQIDAELKPFKNQPSTEYSPNLRDRYNFVRSKEFLRQQEDVINEQIDNLHIAINLSTNNDILLLRNPSAHRPERDEYQAQPQNRHVRRNVSAGSNTERIREWTYEPSRIRRMIEQREDITAKDACGWTVLHDAAKMVDYETLVVILDSLRPHELDFLDEKTLEGETALMITASHADDARSIFLAAALIEKGCDVNIKDSVGGDNPNGFEWNDRRRTALYHALESPPVIERVNFVILLVRHGANVEEMRNTHRGRYERFERSQFFIELYGPPHRRRSSATTLTGSIPNTHFVRRVSTGCIRFLKGIGPTPPTSPTSPSSSSRPSFSSSASPTRRRTSEFH